MTSSDLTSSGAAGHDELIHLLRRLARKDAAGGMAAVNTAPEAVLREAVVAGWIMGTGTGASITAKGRAHLRRVLSRAAPYLGPEKPRTERTAKPSFNPCECPVGWLARRRDKTGQPLISAAQLAAAERLRADFWFAGMSPRVTTNWSEPMSGTAAYATPSDVRDNVAAAAERVRHALADAGPELSSLLIDVCCHLKGLEKIEQHAGWPQRSARIVLDMALTRLARHYGLISNGASSVGPRKPAPIQHWGAPGYRPVINGGDG